MNQVPPDGAPAGPVPGGPITPPAPPRLPFSLLARHAMFFGGVAGLIAGAWMMVDHALGFQTTRPDIGRITSLAALVVPVAATILGVMRWRDGPLGGSMRFAQAFGAALAIGLTFALVLAAAAWLHAAVIVPDLVMVKLEAYATALRASGRVQEAEIEPWLANARARATPASYAYQYFSATLIQNFVVALMAALAVRKRPLARPLPAPKNATQA